MSSDYDQGPIRRVCRKHLHVDSLTVEDALRRSGGGYHSRSGSDVSSTESLDSVGSRGKQRKLGVASMMGNPRSPRTSPSICHPVAVANSSETENTTQNDSSANYSAIDSTRKLSAPSENSDDSGEFSDEDIVKWKQKISDHDYSSCAQHIPASDITKVSNAKTPSVIINLCKSPKDTNTNNMHGFMSDSHLRHRYVNNYTSGNITDRLCPLINRSNDNQSSTETISLLDDMPDEVVLNTINDNSDEDEPTVFQSFTPQVNIEKLRKISVADKGDLTRLKDMADRLQLDTRRPSYMKWKDLHLVGHQRSSSPSISSVQTLFTQDIASLDVQQNESSHSTCDIDTAECERTKSDDMVRDIPVLDMESNCKLSLPERRKYIDSALEWLKTELISMRLVDYKLAKQLVRLRQEIHHFRLEQCCLQNSVLLEDALDEEAAQSDIYCDSLPPMLDPQLRQYGLTKMNIHTRRFSVF